MTAIPLRATASSQKTVQLIIAGASGRVGEALRSQIAALRQGDVRLLPIVEANSRVTSVRLGDRDLRYDTDWRATLALLRHESCGDGIFVDCTASEEVASLYPDLLRAGFHVVTPNKIASAGPLADFLEIRDVARGCGREYRHETTVGAALPLLRTVAELAATGDRIRSIDGVLSGTLSYILNRLHEGSSFSDAVGEAYERGYTEPDPTVDLSGRDVGRKLLILLREGGETVYGSAVAVRPLVEHAPAWHGSIDLFAEALRRRDADWRKRAAEAEAAGKRLVYAARFDAAGARAGVVSVDRDDPIARARPGENVVVIHTDRYAAVPLTISGPGAGPDVTAGGVLAEILEIARR